MKAFGLDSMERPAGFRSDFRMRTHSARAPENRCLRSPRKYRAWISRKRRIGATDFVSAQDLEVEFSDLDSNGSQDRKRS
jgi:hypothetical protein